MASVTIDVERPQTEVDEMAAMIDRVINENGNRMSLEEASLFMEIPMTQVAILILQGDIPYHETDGQMWLDLLDVVDCAIEYSHRLKESAESPTDPRNDGLW